MHKAGDSFQSRDGIVSYLSHGNPAHLLFCCSDCWAKLSEPVMNLSPSSIHTNEDNEHRSIAKVTVSYTFNRETISVLTRPSLQRLLLSSHSSATQSLQQKQVYMLQ
jgi:hypothetical protein